MNRSAIVLVFLGGCSVTARAKDRFAVEGVSHEAEADWAGEAIVVDDDGVGVSVAGGLMIIADATTTRVSATARMLALANADDAPSANASIADATKTFTIATAGGVTTIACHHGGTYGSSAGGESGCELITVHVPNGDAARPISVKGLSGNGPLKVSAPGAFFGTLALDSNGGDIDVTLAANLGATVTAAASRGDDVTFHLPTGFAADEIVLAADPASIDSSAFPDVVNGAGRGPAGTGAALLSLTSTPFAGASGKVTLDAQ